MADNSQTQSVTLATVPAGENFAFDEVTINGVLVKVGRNKIGVGADGSYTEVSVADPLPVTAAALPLPSGAATAAKQDTEIAALATLVTQTDGVEALLTSLDGKTVAVNTGAVVVASSALPTGAATEATLATRLTESDFDTKTGGLTETAPATDTASSGLNGRLQRIAQRLTSLIALIPAALGQGTMAQSLRVVVASDQSAIPVKETRSATSTTSQVADTATSTTLLASNANRLGASIHNDSSAVLYLKCGTTASATDYTARMVQYAYFEVPFGYTGRIDGIWASDPGDGAARITEYT